MPAAAFSNSATRWLGVPLPARPVRELAGVFPGKRYQLRKVLCRDRWMRGEQLCCFCEQGYRGEIENCVIRQRQAIETCIDHERRACKEQCVSIGGRFGDNAGADVACCAGPVVDNDLLPKLVAQGVSEYARDSVVGTAGGDWHDKPHRSNGVLLGKCSGSEC